MISTLSTLNLSWSANFSSDQSVNYFALMLAKAQNLQFVDISVQDGDRKIDVKIVHENEWISAIYKAYGKTEE